MKNTTKNGINRKTRLRLMNNSMKAITGTGTILFSTLIASFIPVLSTIFMPKLAILVTPLTWLASIFGIYTGLKLFIDGYLGLE